MDAQRIVETATVATATVMGAAAAASVFATGQRTALQVCYQMPEDQLRYLQSSTSGQVLVNPTKDASKGGTHPAMRQAREWLYAAIMSHLMRFDNAAKTQGGSICVVFATLADLKRFRPMQSVHFLFSFAELDDAGRCYVPHPDYDLQDLSSYVRVFPELAGRVHSSIQTVPQCDIVLFADCTYNMSNELVVSILHTVGAKIGYNIMILPDAIIYRDDPENHVDNPLHRITRSENSLQLYQSFATQRDRDLIEAQLELTKDPLIVLKYMETHSLLPVALRTKVAAAVMGLPSTRLIWTNTRGGGDKVYDEIHSLWKEKANAVYHGAVRPWVNQLELSSASMRLFKLSPAYGAGVRVISYCLPEVDRHFHILDLEQSVHQFNKSAKTVTSGGILPGRRAAPVYRSVRVQCILPTIDYLSRQPQETLDDFDKCVDLVVAHINRQNSSQSLLQVEKGSFVPSAVRNPRPLAMVLVVNELHHRRHSDLDLEAMNDRGTFLSWLKKIIGAYAPAMLKKFIRWLMAERPVDFWVGLSDHVLTLEDAVSAPPLVIKPVRLSKPVLYPVNRISLRKPLVTYPQTELQQPSLTDGNCGPCSLATLEGCPGEHARVRAEIVNYVKSYPSQFTDLGVTDDWYVDMAKDCTWFDDIALAAWSRMRKRRIGLWRVNSETNEQRFEWTFGKDHWIPAIITWYYREQVIEPEDPLDLPVDELEQLFEMALDDLPPPPPPLVDEGRNQHYLHRGAELPPLPEGERPVVLTHGQHFQPRVNPKAPEGENGQEKLFEADQAVCASAVASGCTFVVVVGVSPGTHWIKLLDLYPSLRVIGYDEAECKVKHPRFLWHPRYMTETIASTLATERVALIFDHRTAIGGGDPSPLDKLRDNYLAYKVVKAMRPCIVSYKVAGVPVPKHLVPPVIRDDPEFSRFAVAGKITGWFGLVGDDCTYSYQHYMRLGASELRCLTSLPDRIDVLDAVTIRQMIWTSDLERCSHPIAAVTTVAKSACDGCGTLGYAKTCRACLTAKKQATAQLVENSSCPLCKAALAMNTAAGNFLPPAVHSPSLHLTLSVEEVTRAKASLIEQIQQATSGLNKVLTQAQDAIRPVVQVDVNVNVYQMNGTPGCGKTKLMIQVMKTLYEQGVDKVLVVIPMLKLLSEYTNIPGLPSKFFEVKTPHKALSYLTTNKPQWILYDELGAMQFQMVAFCMALAGEGSSHILVGDKNQTRVRANEGDEFWNNLTGSDHVDFDKCGVHFSCANYRNPRAVVLKANAYITESAKMIPMSQKLGGIGYINLHDHAGVSADVLTKKLYGVDYDAKDTLHMVFAKKTWVFHHPDEGEAEAITVRTCQGQTTRNAVLHLSGKASALIKNSPQCLVALTRATEWLIIVVHDNDQTCIAWATALRTDMEALTGGSMLPDYRAIPDVPLPEPILPEVEVRPGFDAFARYRDERGAPTEAEIAKLVKMQSTPLPGKFNVTVKDGPLQTDSAPVKEFSFVTNPISADIVPQMRTDAMEARTALKRIAQVPVSKQLSALDREIIVAKMTEFFDKHKHKIALPTSVLHELDRFDESARQKHYVERILGDLQAKPYEELLHNYVSSIGDSGYFPATVRAGMKEQVKVSNVNKTPDWSKVGQAISCFPAQMIVKSSLLVRVLAAIDQQSYNATGQNRVHLKQRLSDEEFRETSKRSLAKVICAMIDYSDGGEMDVGNTQAGWFIVELFISFLFKFCPEAEMLFPNWRQAWAEMVDLSTDVRVVFKQFEMKSGLATPSGCSFTYFITCVLNIFWNFVCFKTQGETVRLVGGDDGITAAYKIEDDVQGQLLFNRVMNISLKSVHLEGSYAEFCGDLVMKVDGIIRMVPYMYRKARKILCAKVNDEAHLIELQREARAATIDMRDDEDIRVVNIIALMRDGMSAEAAVSEYDRVAEAFVSFGRSKTADVMRGLVKMTLPIARC